MMPGVAQPRRVDELRQSLRDRLVEAMGPARTGDVSWLTYDNDQARTRAKGMGWDDCVEALDEWPDAYLVIAVAPGWPHLWSQPHT
jgi:hypothetical protein